VLTKPIPPWILIGGTVLAACAGCINAAGLIGLHHQALSHMSGTAAVLGAELARAQYDAVWHALLILTFFFLGCVLSGVLVREKTLQLGRRYGIALVCESALLFAATYFLVNGQGAGDHLAAMACGLQNALATSYSGAVIRTTHITGIITDLGIAAGSALRRDRVDRRRVGLYLLLAAGFVGGSVLGGLGYVAIGFYTLLFPAAITGTAGLGYAVYRFYESRRTGPTRPPF
jgi:uncharacterized membrane protein YoaK (UPF0700 family)